MFYYGKTFVKPESRYNDMRRFQMLSGKSRWKVYNFL